MNRQPQRPTCADVRALLKSCEGLIVHFSTSPSMHADPLVHYPLDLHTALTSACCLNGGLSCSVVTPSDPFTGATRFVPGYIGIILDPRESQSIVSCSTVDGGDTRDLQTCTVMGEFQNVDLSIEDLRRTITGRTDYNNWLVKDYKVLGILALPPFRVARIIQDDIAGPVRVEAHVSIRQVSSEFPNLPIYTIADGRYFQLRDEAIVGIGYDNIWLSDHPSRAS